MILVIVESPAKAKKIEAFLGSGYTVRASVGHIRDMPGKDMSVDIDNNFKPTYQISKDKHQVVAGLKKLSKQADQVILATDDDREGEAIAWHLVEVLNIPANSPRAKFHEITKKEITNVITNKLELLDMNMVNAQQARRVLDRLVGYEISPVLWNKVKGASSAGRVQSPVTRVIVDRENEINAFKVESTFKAKFHAVKDGKEFKADILNFNEAEKQGAWSILTDHLNNKPFRVTEIDQQPIIKKPPAPFTTSTFQQAVSSILGLSPKQAMSAAQKLYMDGLITYMRTDSPTLSQEAIDDAKSVIESAFGARYSQERQFKSKGALAQEAHEAIRPTKFSTESVDNDDSISQKVYSIIRNRTLASQMADSQIEQTVVSFTTSKGDYKAVTKGQVVVFDGFTKLSNVSVTDDLLPNLNVGDDIIPSKIVSKESFKKPKSRYTEALLVKKLEALGIGRPSTFASMVDTVQQRGYVTKQTVAGSKVNCCILTLENGVVTESSKQEAIGADKNKLVPTESAHALIDFMREYFSDVIDYEFTANIEKEFDRISLGQITWTNMLHNFYNDFHSQVEAAQSLAKDRVQDENSSIGECPDTGAMITTGKGKYGHFVKLNTEKAKFANIPKHINPENINLSTALALLTLPRTLGQHNGVDIIAMYGRNGGFLKCGASNISLKDGEPESITLDIAIEYYKKREHELDSAPKCESCKKPLIVRDGKYGKFYSCTGFPKCKHKQPKKPLNYNKNLIK